MGGGGERLILVYADKNLFRCIETYEVSDIIVLYSNSTTECDC